MFNGFDDKTAIGKRLRFLSMLIDYDAKRVYEAQGIHFEQRWFGLLNQLTLNGSMTVSSLADVLRISHASVSETRKSLEAANLIYAVPDPSDRRQRLLSLTPSGIEFTQTLHPIWQALENVSQDLNREAGDIIAALEKLDGALAARSLFDRAMDKLN